MKEIIKELKTLKGELSTIREINYDSFRISKEQNRLFLGVIFFQMLTMMLIFLSGR